MSLSMFAYDAHPPVLTVAEEVALIHEAQTGSPAAYLTLAHAYGPILRTHAAQASKTAERDDVEAELIAAFSEVLYSHDPENPNYADGRLAPRLSPALVGAMAAFRAAGAAAFVIPSRTLSRYYGIMREAGNDLGAALELAPSHAMTAETFTTVYYALTEARSLEAAAEGTDPIDGATSVFGVENSVYDEATDAILVDVAFMALDDEAERITRLAYGFTDFRPKSDAEISDVVGLTRPTVQRRRVSALRDMRKALSVSPIPA